jgi:hypothetical protein
VEEALAMPHYLPVAQSRAPQILQPLLTAVSVPAFLVAVSLATLAPLVIVTWAALRPDARWAHWAAAVVQATLALNVLSHVASVVAMRGYAPGAATAVLLNLPFSVYFFTRAARLGWLSPRALWATIPAAIIVHGPGLIGLLALSRRLA